LARTNSLQDFLGFLSLRSEPSEQTTPSSLRLRSFCRFVATWSRLIFHFYFDDQHWVICYVIADTSSWLPGRLVLLSPHAFRHFNSDSDRLSVNLTQQQIENSPAIESHKPVSRQYEEEYDRYYGWPSYWVGGGKWGIGGFPSSVPRVTKDATFDNYVHTDDDPHLRSTKARATTAFKPAKKRSAASLTL
jgi:hypothetical protein